MGATPDQLTNQLAAERQAISRDLEAIGEHISPGQIAHRRSAAAKARLNSAKQRVMGTADNATGKVKESASSMADTLTDSPETARRAVQGNPLAVGLIAFGAGLLIGTVLPETETESNLLSTVQPELEDFAASAAESVRDVTESMKPELREAGEGIKQTATDAAHAVKDTATSSG